MKKVIKKKKFLKVQNIELMKKFAGDNVDMEAEFDVIDEENKEQISFEDMVKMLLKKNMSVELEKQQKKEEEEEKEGRSGSSEDEKKEE